MYFQVEPAVWSRFPGMRIAAVVAQGLDNTVPRPAIGDAWQATWAEARAAATHFGNPQSHPHVRPWRDYWRALGVSSKDFPSSIEALLRRAGKGGPPFTINPLVDWYNTVSLRFIVPAGGYDLAAITAPLTLRLTGPGDTFLALDATEPVTVPSGEVAYTTSNAVLTRHLLWRQSRLGLLTPQTQDALLVSELPAELDDALAEQVLAALVAGLAEHFGVVGQGALVDERQPQLRW